MTPFPHALPVPFWPDRRATYVALLLGVAVAVGCSPQAQTERILRNPQPLRLECPAESLFAGLTTSTAELRADAPAIGGVDSLDDLRRAGRFRRVPAMLEGARPALELPFSPTTPPLSVIARDLNRVAERRGGIRVIVADTGAVAQSLPPSALSMRANLVAAQAFSRSGVVTRSLLAQVVFDVGLLGVASSDTAPASEPLWKARFIGENRSKQGYVESRDYELALNAAYCSALRAFGDSVAAPSGGVQAALRR